MVYSNRVKLLAKKANERMRQFEKRNIASPAYKAAQARLEQLGVISKTAKGRRFSETGKFVDNNQMSHIESILNTFLGQKTSTIKGYKDYRSNVLEGAKKRYDLPALGLSDEEYLDIWEYLPEKEADRIFGSDDDVRIVSEVLQKQRTGELSSNYSVAELMGIIHDRRSTVKETLGKFGMTVSDLIKPLGKLQ